LGRAQERNIKREGKWEEEDKLLGMGEREKRGRRERERRVNLPECVGNPLSYRYFKHCTWPPLAALFHAVSSTSFFGNPFSNTYLST
jgi:hypothetical protein